MDILSLRRLQDPSVKVELAVEDMDLELIRDFQAGTITSKYGLYK